MPRRLRLRTLRSTALRSENGSYRKSSPSSDIRSNARATALRSFTRLCNASKSATPSVPIQTTSASRIAEPPVAPQKRLVGGWGRRCHHRGGLLLLSCFVPENLAYIKNKKRGSRERSPPPCQIKTLILPRCPEARGNIDLDLTLTRKFFELSGHAARSSRIASTHHQTVFEPPFMTASARYCRS
jgi:hypothetical protein